MPPIAKDPIPIPPATTCLDPFEALPRWRQYLRVARERTIVARACKYAVVVGP